MDTGLLVGIDLGTSSVKVVVLDTEGRPQGEATRAYAVRTPHPGWVESAPADWWSAVCAAVPEAVGSRGRHVTAIGVVGQMHGAVLTDAAGTPTRPAILWADTRSTGSLAAYRALDEAARQRLANPVVTGMAGPTLLWLRDNEPERYAAARWALQPKDWLRFLLTGQATAEPSDASATLLYDLPADDWAWWLVDALGLRRDLLAPLVASGDVAGVLSSTAAAAIGLPEGLPVAAGAGDTAAAALGSGLLDPPAVQVTVGTGGQVLAALDRPAGDPRRRTHLYRAAAAGRWYAMGATLNGGLALEWVRRVLSVDWPAFYEEAAAAPPGAGGVRFLPYLGGERTPHLDAGARGAWVGIGVDHGRGHLLRAALEGVAFALRDCLGALVDAGVVPPSSDREASLRLAGGGSRHPMWRQLLADVLGRPLDAVETPNASARGAALLAGVAGGVYDDVRTTLQFAPGTSRVAEPGSCAGTYDAAYTGWRELYPRLHLPARHFTDAGAPTV